MPEIVCCDVSGAKFIPKKEEAPSGIGEEAFPYLFQPVVKAGTR
jgi:hypothetical protein